MKQRLLSKTLGALVLLLLTSAMGATTTFACSFVNEAAAISEATATTGTYWIVSILLGLMIISMEIYHRRWSLVLVFTGALLIFHPYWTVPALYKADCTFINVQSAQIVLVILLVMIFFRGISISRKFRVEVKKHKNADSV
jgi:hypothetical protein